MRVSFKIFLWCFGIILVCLWHTGSNCQNAKPTQNEVIIWDRVMMDKVSITNPETIKFLLKNCYIFSTEEVTRLDIYDVTGNGFGEKDIAETYPDRSIHFLDFVNDIAQKRMNEFEPPENYEKVGENLDPGKYESEGVAQSGILASLLRGVKRNVKRSPVQIWFRQDSTGVFKFMMSGYKEQELKFTRSWPEDVPSDTINISHPALGDTSFVVRSKVDYDILREFIEQALPEFTTDVLKIYIIESDTLYLDRDEKYLKDKAN